MTTRWILLGVAVAALYVCLGNGDGLICYECDTVCTSITRSPVKCNPGEKCGIRKRYKGFVSLTDGMCMNSTMCATQGTGTIATVMYEINTTCCNQDLCNAGTSARLSLLSGLAAVGLLWLCT